MYLWTKQKLAERLEMSPNLLHIGLVDKALEILQNSPLLKTGPFPRIPKRNPRKRDDYKCGICGKKKRNHVCHNNGGNDNMNNGFDMQDDNIKKEENDDEPFVNDEDDEDEEMGEFGPPLKKRKKVFKPMIVMMHNTENENMAINALLTQIQTFGEKTVEARLNTHINEESGEYEIYGEIVFLMEILILLEEFQRDIRRLLRNPLMIDR